MPTFQDIPKIVKSNQRLTCLIYFFACFSLYNFTNSYTQAVALHKIIPTLAIKIDSQIPFIASFITLYSCSLWLLSASFFIVAKKNLYHLTHRLLIATLLACCLFYWMPFRFSFALPINTHAFGSLAINWKWAFDILHMLDKPYNQFPSLHVGYATLLLASLWTPMKVFQSNLTSYRLCLTFLCSGIVLSTLFTWQHHVLDLLGGIVLALAVLWIERRISHKLPLASQKLVIRYLVITVAGFLLIAGFPLFFTTCNHRFGLIFFKFFAYYWLVSFTLLSFLYYKSNISLNKLIFAKNQQGQLRYFAYLLQAPIIISYQLVWLSMVRFKQLTPFANHQSIKFQYKHQPIEIIAIPRLDHSQTNKVSWQMDDYQKIIWLDVSSEISSSFYQLKTMLNTQQVEYKYLPILDLQPFTSIDISTLSHFLYDIRCALSVANHQATRPILLVCQCTMGWSRSVGMVACCLAYLSDVSVSQIRLLVDLAYPHHHANLDDIANETLRILRQNSRNIA